MNKPFALWERYFFVELLKPFFLFLSSFYLLYTILDYSTHMQDFIKEGSPSFSIILKYYSYHFIKRMPLLLTLALLLSTIKVLTSANVRNELLALQGAGIKLRRIIRPFFVVSLCLTGLIFFSFQTLGPKAQSFIDHFHAEHLKHSKSKGMAKVEHIHVLYLNDGTKLVFQSYDPQKGAFFDAFWVINSDDLWRIKTLAWENEILVGHFVDHLIREPQGNYSKRNSFGTYFFTTMDMEKATTRTRLIPLAHRSFSALIPLLSDPQEMHDKETVQTEIFLRIVYALFPPLLILALTPFCVVFHRGFSQFFIYVFGIIGFVLFFTVLDAAVILGENGVFSPFICLFGPYFLLTLLFGSQFYRKVIK